MGSKGSTALVGRRGGRGWRPHLAASAKSWIAGFPRGCLLEQVGTWSGGGAAKGRFETGYDGPSRWPGNLAIWID
jgi:hypothetical protein